MTFEDFNLNTPILKALHESDYKIPTTIQSKAYNLILSGKDIIGIAQTGTGKTLAYLLPCIKQWSFSKEKQTQILVIVPTRELVVQVVEEAKKITAYMNLNVLGIYGGVNIKTQALALKTGADLIVATPGRLLDLVLNGALKLKYVKKLVIDEFDEMLNLGFRPQLIRVIDLLPLKRQNLLFSATVNEETDNFVQTFFNFPTVIEAAKSGTPLEKIIQTGFSVPNFFTKVNLLEYLINKNKTMTKVLVFTSTKHLADILFTEITKKVKVKIGVIHSNKSQNHRFDSVKNFQNGQIKILIATDVIARGIDIDDITHVINFDVPDVAENYIHRIGRTGRADKDGNAIIFVGKKEKTLQTKIEKLMKQKIPMEILPEELEISKLLLDEEKPKSKLKIIEVKVAKIENKGEAFHTKSIKNLKVNNKIRHEDKMKKKYGKPKTRGQKRK